MEPLFDDDQQEGQSSVPKQQFASEVVKELQSNEQQYKDQVQRFFAKEGGTTLLPDEIMIGPKEEGVMLKPEQQPVAHDEGEPLFEDFHAEVFEESTKDKVQSTKGGEVVEEGTTDNGQRSTEREEGTKDNVQSTMDEKIAEEGTMNNEQGTTEGEGSTKDNVQSTTVMEVKVNDVEVPEADIDSISDVVTEDAIVLDEIGAEGQPVSEIQEESSSKETLDMSTAPVDGDVPAPVEMQAAEDSEITEVETESVQEAPIEIVEAEVIDTPVVVTEDAPTEEVLADAQVIDELQKESEESVMTPVVTEQPEETPAMLQPEYSEAGDVEQMDIQLSAMEHLFDVFSEINPQLALDKREYDDKELSAAEEAFHQYFSEHRVSSVAYDDANEEFKKFIDIYAITKGLQKIKEEEVTEDEVQFMTRQIKDDFFLYQDPKPIRYLLEYFIGISTRPGAVEYLPYIDYKVMVKRPYLACMIFQLFFDLFPVDNPAFMMSITDEIYQDRKKYVRFKFECSAHSQFQEKFAKVQSLYAKLFDTIRGRFGLRMGHNKIEVVMDFSFVVEKDEEPAA